MSDIQIYLLEVDENKAEAERIVSSCAQRLESKQLKLLDLVGSLQEYINNREDGSQRAKTVTFLADVLTALPPRVLSGQERRLLCDFILGRLGSDLEGIGSSAKALIALESLGKWDAATAKQTLKSFLTYANPLRQFKLQTDRFAVIQLVDLILANYRDAIHELHQNDHEFMPSFVSFFEGEKDPRNLMIIFSLLQVPMTEWDISSNAQDLFELVFNYFPITFKPPPDDPYGITAQDLKDRLRACIASNSDFAPHAFPHLLDKLDSTSMNTKRDVLQTIQACLIGYEAKTINLYSVTLWDALKFEVLNVQEDDLAENALQALALIAAKFTPIEEGPLNAYLRPIIKECNEHLEDAPTKQSQAAGRIVYALASSSLKTAERIVKGILPTLFRLYTASESITKRRGLLEVFNEVLKGYAELQADAPNLDVSALQDFSSEALHAMLRTVTNAPKSEVSFRLTALQGLVRLISIAKVLTDADVFQAIDAVTDVVLHERIEGHGDIRKSATESLISMAHIMPRPVQDRTIPAFMVELPDSSFDASAVAPVLEAFAKLSTERQIFDTVVLRLKNKFNAVRQAEAPAEYQRALLLAMLYSFTFGSPTQENDCIRSDYYLEYASPLVEIVRRLNTSEHESKAIETIGRICNIILRPQGVHFQSTIYNSDLAWLTELTHQSEATTTTPFLLHYYAAIRAEVADSTNIVNLLRTQAQQALETHQQRTNNLRMVSLLLNKFVDSKQLQTTLEASQLDVGRLLGPAPSGPAIALSFAITKALLLQGRSAQLSTQYLKILQELLANPANKIAAQYFSTLLVPDDILTKENHCIVSGLYKQKLFNNVIPQLIEAVKPQPDTSGKANYLVAICGILRWLPYSLLKPSLFSLISPLLQTLDLAPSVPHEYQEVKVTALTNFESMLMHDANLLSEHTSSLVTRLLNSTTVASNATATRAKALQCLALVPRQLKAETIIPYRRQVVRKLVDCLDDGKRNVRVEAVRCRKAWLGLDDGGEDDE